jgi:hypothetical protein
MLLGGCGQGAAGRLKLRVERQPFLASKAVIFGVNPIGPHILCVIPAMSFLDDFIATIPP